VVFKGFFFFLNLPPPPPLPVVSLQSLDLTLVLYDDLCVISSDLGSIAGIFQLLFVIMCE